MIEASKLFPDPTNLWLIEECVYLVSQTVNFMANK